MHQKVKQLNNSQQRFSSGLQSVDLYSFIIQEYKRTRFLNQSNTSKGSIIIKSLRFGEIKKRKVVETSKNSLNKRLPTALTLVLFPASLMGRDGLGLEMGSQLIYYIMTLIKNSFQYNFETTLCSKFKHPPSRTSCQDG